MDEKFLLKKIELMLQVIEDVYPSPRRIMWLSFLRGIFLGLGSTIGVALVIAILTYILNQLAQIPGVNLEGIKQLLKINN